MNPWRQFGTYALKKYKYIFVLCLVFFAAVTFAQNPSSTNFQLENPGFMLEGGLSTSSSFQYLSNTSTYTFGESTGSSFLERDGFLFFPVATSSVVSATAGDAQAVLTWTAATGTLANVTSYSLGTSTSPSSGFVYTSVGNVLGTTKTGLVNGVTYYFKIQAYASGILLSESTAVSALPAGATSGGSGGGGSSGSSSTRVVIFGKAYPASTVTFLKDGQIVATSISGSDARFNVQLSNVTPGNYTFGVYAVDKNGVRSTLQSFPITVTAGVTANVGSIFISPTISGDKTQVKKGDDITFFGQSTPLSDITISVHSSPEFIERTTTDQSGVYLHSFNTLPLAIGSHEAKSKAISSGQLSTLGAPFAFKVGAKNIIPPPTEMCPAKGDLNTDCKVNIVDFSIAAFWYKRPLSESVRSLERTKLSGDAKIDLADFSIMAFYWTG